MRKRLASILLAILTAVGVFVVTAAPAGAAAPAPPPPLFGNSVSFTGTGVDKAGQAHQVTGVLEARKVVRHAQGAALVGTMTVTDQATGKKQSQNVSAPGTLEPAAAPAAGDVSVQQLTCNVLNLVLGPLHLNLLGLVIDLNQVILTITAIPSSEPGGGLLGDILCALSGGPTPTGGTLSGLLNQLIGFLNQILAGIGG